MASRFQERLVSASALAILFFQYPVFAQTPVKTLRVLVSPETVSQLTETPAGDYLIPESQVFIGGKDGAGRWLALLGVAIDNARNQVAVGESAGRLRMSFDSTVATALASVALTDAIFEQVKGSTYDAKLLPSARVLVQDEKRAHLSFRLTARTRDKSADKEITKNYYYGLSGLRPLVGNGGWTENDAEAVLAASRTAFGRLVEAFARDAAGHFAEGLRPDKRRVVRLTNVNGGPQTSAVLLAQTAQDLIVVPMIREHVLFLTVQVIDRATVSVDGLERQQ